MHGKKRFAVCWALAWYLLSTTAIQSLHDHSAQCGCCGDPHSLAATAGDCHGRFHCESADCNGHDCDCAELSNGPNHDHRAPHSNHCDDSCVACRFLAIKALAPTIVAVANCLETVQRTESPRLLSPAVADADVPLARGPPSV